MFNSITIVTKKLFDSPKGTPLNLSLRRPLEPSMHVSTTEGTYCPTTYTEIDTIKYFRHLKKYEKHL